MNVTFDATTLREIARPLVEEVVSAIGTTGDSDRLAYPEAEAATKVLGIAPHQLRDARLRGEIVATKVGGRIGYERTELLSYLARGRDES